MDKTQDFLLKEYETVRAEMDSAVIETRTLERYALVAVGAIWSWFITNPNPKYEALKWLPFLLVAFLAFRALVLAKHVKFIATYLTKVEDKFEVPSGLGFEKNFKGHGKLKTFSAYIFWAVLLILTLSIPYVYNSSYNCAIGVYK